MVKPCTDKFTVGQWVHAAGGNAQVILITSRSVWVRIFDGGIFRDKVMTLKIPPQYIEPLPAQQA